MAATTGTMLALGGASLLGGLIGSKASKDAAQTQADASRQAAQTQADAASQAAQAQLQAAQEANKLQWDIYQQNRADAEPWRVAGQGALGKLSDLAGNYQGYGKTFDPGAAFSFGAADMLKDPGYAFRMQEGQKALERSAAARGGALGGGTLKALARYGQDFASNEYGNAYSRAANDYANNFNRNLSAFNTNYSVWNTDQNQNWNRLAGLAGVGQTATSQLGQMGMQTAGQMGQNLTGGATNANNWLTQGANQSANSMMNAANAQAAGQVGSANAWMNGINGGLNSWLQWSMLGKLNPPMDGK